jgi:hypothetical protein
MTAWSFCISPNGRIERRKLDNRAQLQSDASNPKTQSSGYIIAAQARTAKASNVSKVLSTLATDALSLHQHSISKTIGGEQIVNQLELFLGLANYDIMVDHKWLSGALAPLRNPYCRLCESTLDLQRF